VTVEGTGHHLIEKGTPESLEMRWYSNGELIDPGTVTIGIVDARGAEVVAAGTATTGAGVAARAYALTADLAAACDVYSVTWTPDADYGPQTQEVEIIGEHLFTLTELAYFDDRAVTVAGIPTSRMERMRRRLMDEFEEICGVAFMPRYRLLEVDGTGRSDVLLPNIRVTAIRSIDYRDSGSSEWTEFSAGELADVRFSSWGRVQRETLGTFTYGLGNWRIGYEHGWKTVPADINDAALTAARYLIVPSNLSSRALQQSADFGTIQLATAGRHGDHYGIPAVDSVLDRRCEKVPAVG
jgi:hypothetical protein